jgi:AAA domain, putative AbiEii toxin, Type IV TA system
MKLKAISINLVGDENNNSWQLDALELTNFSLLVGRNSTGKTRTLTWFEILIGIINQPTPDYFGILSGLSSTEFRIDLEIDNDLLSYYFSTKVQDISEEDEGIIGIFEKITYRNKVVLDRNLDETKIYSFSQDAFLQINPPNNKLVVHVRRDKKEFPFLEHLALWASKSFFYSFSGEAHNLGNFSPSHDELSSDSLENIKKDMNYLGYKLNDIFFREWGQGKKKLKTLRFAESGLSKSLRTEELSQGMERVFDVLALIEELSKNKKALFIAIDNLSEGLDYERATKLGKLLVEKLENSNIQFIATSNDSFLMDVIPIKYWNILQRDGNTVRALNYQNSKERFDKFLMTGLSNFDLFSSDYLMRPKP